MCPPRLVLAPLEGHHAEVKGWQDLVSSTKFLVPYLTSARKSKPCSLSLSPAFLGRVWKKKKKRGVYAMSFAQTLFFLGVSGL